MAVLLSVERRRSTIRTVVALLAALGAPACATLLDFEDPVDLPPDASSTFGEDAGVEADGSATRLPVADPDACACPPIPAGWRGPLRLEETTGMPAACGGDFPTLVLDLHAGPQGAPATCSCACGAPRGIACGAPTAEHFVDIACGAICATGAPVAGCARPTCTGAVGSVRVSSAATGGSCLASASIQTSPPAWTTQVRLCGGKSCGSDCGADVCIAKRGTEACPADFPRAHVAFGALADTRACTACTCGGPTGATCGGSVASYPTAACGGAATTASFGACVPYETKGRISATSGTTATGGACAPIGGAPTGIVAAADPTTICCRF